MKKILIVGATSAIAEHTARLFAADGDTLFLVARSQAKLTAVADDLKVRGAHSVDTYVMDADDLNAHDAMVEAADTALGGFDTVLVAYGTLPDQAAAQAEAERAVEAWHTNAVSPIALVTPIANRMAARGEGLIAVISSVAGDRGRKSNYVYGSAKAGVNAFLDGLRHRLYASGVQVLTVRPGLVDTPMTADMKKGALFAQPERIGRDIHNAINKRQAICYTPGFWRLIMTIICCVPRALFHRTQL